MLDHHFRYLFIIISQNTSSHTMLIFGYPMTLMINIIGIMSMIYCQFLIVLW